MMKQQNRFRPRLEALEDRLVPDAMIWENTLGTGKWSDAGNWSQNHVPQTGDTLTFSALGGGSTASCTDMPNNTTLTLGQNGIAGLFVSSTYTGAITISPGSSITDSSNAVSIQGLIDFADNTSSLTLTSGSIQAGGSFSTTDTTRGLGKLYVTHSLNWKNGSGDYCMANVEVKDQGTLTFKSQVTPLNVDSSATWTVDAGGTIVFSGAKNQTNNTGGLQLLSGSTTTGLIDDYGTVERANVETGTLDTISSALPIKVENGVSVQGYLFVGSNLTMEFDHSDTATSGYSVYNHGGWVDLSGVTTGTETDLIAQNGFYQDLSASILDVSGNGSAHLGRNDLAGSVAIANGAVQFNHGQAGNYGQLDVDGSFNQSGGTLFFTVDGTMDNNMDALNCHGTFTTTGGSLDVQAFNFNTGHSWTIISGSSRSGTWDAQHRNFHSQALTLVPLVDGFKITS
jgi:hypothetical protein